MTYEKEMFDIRLNGANIHYLKLGQGQPIILLHGALGTGLAQWGDYIDDLSKKFTVYLLDLRGHGKSTNPKGIWRIDQYVEDLISFIKQVEINRPIVCGWSMGATIAMRLMLADELAVKGYILGGASLNDGGLDRSLRQMLGINDDGHVDIEQLRKAKPDLLELVKAIQGEENWRRLIQGWGKLCVEENEIDLSSLSNGHEKVLFVIGDSDEFIRVESVTELAKLFTNAQVAVIPGASHALVRTNKEDLFKLIVAFEDESV